MGGQGTTATITITDSDDKGAHGEASLKPHLFLVFESHRLSAPAARFALDGLQEVTVGRGAARKAVPTIEAGTRRLEVQVDDPWMSSTHARLLRVLGRWALEDAGSKNGSLVNGIRQTRATLADGDVIELGHTFFLFREAVPCEPGDAPILQVGGPSAAETKPPAPGLSAPGLSAPGLSAPGLSTHGLPTHALPTHALSAPGLSAPGLSTHGLSTLSPGLARELARLSLIARSTVSVIIEGETGTGKEVAARALHALSGRSGDFVAVNCGALPEALVEGELFGHRKGAFSGATEDRPGLIRSADRGTLFLDEIGDLRPPSQAAFLRALQEREVLPVGGTRPIPVDVRVVSATHRPLDQMALDGDFRADLHARISGHRLVLPPLRARREDLGLLIAALLTRLAPERAESAALQPKAARALLRHEWPGNVRELEKALGAAVVLAQGGPIEFEHLPPAVQGARSTDAASPSASASPSPSARARSPEDEARREQLIADLREHRGNITAVARARGMARMQVQRWLKRYAIDPESFRR